MLNLAPRLEVEVIKWKFVEEADPSQLGKQRTFPPTRPAKMLYNVQRRSGFLLFATRIRFVSTPRTRSSSGHFAASTADHLCQQRRRRSPCFCEYCSRKASQEVRSKQHGRAISDLHRQEGFESPTLHSLVQQATKVITLLTPPVTNRPVLLAWRCFEN